MPPKPPAAAMLLRLPELPLRLPPGPNIPGVLCGVVCEFNGKAPTGERGAHDHPKPAPAQKPTPRTGGPEDAVPADGEVVAQVGAGVVLPELGRVVEAREGLLCCFGLVWWVG